MERNRGHHVHAFLPTWPSSSNHKLSSLRHSSLTHLWYKAIYIYIYTFHSKVQRCLAKHLILIIQSYCDDDTLYTAALVLHHLITQIQWSLD